MTNMLFNVRSSKTEEELEKERLEQEALKINKFEEIEMLLAQNNSRLREEMQAYTDQVAGCKRESEAVDKRSKDTENKVGINNEILVKLEKEVESMH